MRNPYEVLGVAPDGFIRRDLQKAYRKLAKNCIPISIRATRRAEEKFKEIAGAYDLLGDADKRRRLDAGEIDAAGAERPQQQFYRDFAGSGSGSSLRQDDSGYADFMDADDALAELLRRSERARANRRGRDLFYRLPIGFAESITGANKRVTLPDGGTLDVTIPPGLVDGQVLRLRGKGAPGFGEGGPGDALVEVDVRPDRRFTREGDDISLELPVSTSFPRAVLGGQIRVPTPTGDVTMAVPKGSNTGTTLRLKGKGAPRRGGGHGDQFVKLKQVVLPKPPGSRTRGIRFWKPWKTRAGHSTRVRAAHHDHEQAAVFEQCGPADTRTLDVWLEQRWLILEQTSAGENFSDIDVARAHFIRDLEGRLRSHDEGVDVILHLVDQLHGLRRVLRAVAPCDLQQPSARQGDGTEPVGRSS